MINVINCFYYYINGNIWVQKCQHCRNEMEFRSMNLGATLAMESLIWLVNREEITIEDFKNSIENWQIPKVQLNQIYQQSKFNLFSKTDYLIQTE